jgi:hypothetical protein
MDDPLMAADLEHEFVSADGWPRDLQAFAMASLLWGGFLLVRAIFALRAGATAVPFEDVFLGVKFYGDHARVTMALQAIIFVTFAIGILMHKRWGLILALLYMAQVVIGHVIFIVSNLGVESQRIHVKIASIESPVVLLIALYIWYRARPLLNGTSPQIDSR